MAAFRVNSPLPSVKQVMRTLSLFSIVLLVAVACNKNTPEENGPNGYTTYHGKLLDASTGHGIPYVPITAYTSEGSINDAWNGTLTVRIRSIGYSDTSGAFKLEYPDQYLVYMGCAHLPEGYQYWATGSYGFGNLYLNENDFYDIKGERFILKKGFSPVLRVFPVTYFSIGLPPLTPELKKDTLVLHLANPYTSDYTESYFLGYPLTTFYLRKPRYLEGDNYVRGRFELRNNGQLKTGDIQVYCPPHDTTVVQLEF